MGIMKYGSFDFPLGIQADKCKGNVDPGPHLPEIEEWYGSPRPRMGLGNPRRHQGWPCIMEWTQEVEDPQVDPWIDMLLDEDKEAVIFHTGRLSGDMVLELADATHSSLVTAHAVPYKAGNVIPLHTKETTLEPQQPHDPNVWFWYSETELVYTLMVKFDPPRVKLTPGEVYKLLVEWEFYHTIPATGKKHLEPFAGFDDSITFKMLSATTP
jgi:hypothetical protein